MNIWIDGGGANLPGQTAKLAVVFDSGKSIIRSLGKLTNNEAEYTALLEALYNPESRESLIHTDSQLLVGHLEKGWKLKAKNLKPYYDAARKLLKEKNSKLKWVRREENKAGILLEKKLK